MIPGGLDPDRADHDEAIDQVAVTNTGTSTTTKSAKTEEQAQPPTGPVPAQATAAA